MVLVKLHHLLLITSAIYLTTIVRPVESHGRLIEPPSRASAWRYGFSTPHNYNDHELYCGGFTRQWITNGGKCGVCGDPWDSKLPRAHEFGGTYGQGVIVRKYGVGARITIRIELTASHFGYFEFAICPNYKNTSQDCLKKQILRQVKPQENAEHVNGQRYFPKDGNKVYEMKYRLPNMTCTHCVLQWRYVAGNNWGTCSNGTGAVGCGPQEEFRACSDITITGTATTDTLDYDDTVTHSPIDIVPKPPQSPAEGDTPTPSYSPFSSLLITLVSFLVIFSVLCLIYWHYYQVGSAVGGWMLDRHRRLQGRLNRDKEGAGLKKAPLPPPRSKRKIGLECGEDGLHEISLHKGESCA